MFFTSTEIEKWFIWSIPNNKYEAPPMRPRLVFWKAIPKLKYFSDFWKREIFHLVVEPFVVVVVIVIRPCLRVVCRRHRHRRGRRRRCHTGRLGQIFKNDFELNLLPGIHCFDIVLYLKWDGFFLVKTSKLSLGLLGQFKDNPRLGLSLIFLQIWGSLS